MGKTDFRTFFAAACGAGQVPYPYQERLACGEPFPELLDVPTGLGKTAAAVLAWLWRRRFHADKAIRGATPRRLVYCLPMRVLVEQTYGEAIRWLARLGLLAGEAYWDQLEEGVPLTTSRLAVPNGAPPDASPYTANPDAPLGVGWAALHDDFGKHPIAVHLLMGGEEKTDWALWPERDAILIGTQDMLLSRVLNRGYAAGRARWPMEFGLLNNDCLWVFDEVQCMGNGLVTTSQIAAFASRLWQQQPRCLQLWMSATIGTTFLHTRDREDWNLVPGHTLPLLNDDLDDQRLQKRLRAEKSLRILNDRPKAARILDEHIEGRLSLVVLNTVPAARAVYADLLAEANKSSRKNKGRPPQICVIHGRFRHADRRTRMKSIEHFLACIDKETGAAPDGPGFVLVATQVIEAGIDISSARLWSEIAPWASVVQRLGRLNRDGLQSESTGTFWMPKDDKAGENSKESPNAKRVGPYEKATLAASLKLLELVVDLHGRGVSYRNALDQATQTSEGQRSLQVEADAVIRPDDFYGLFSTDPDLAGGFTNISPFIRSSDRNADVQVFWRDIAANRLPDPQSPKPSREELCSTPYYDLRRFLGAKGYAWEWDHDAAVWARRRATDVQPGMTLLLPLASGGYSDELGWTGITRDKPSIDSSDNESNDALNRDPHSAAQNWVTISAHTSDVELELQTILHTLQLREPALAHSLRLAARWHDWGKSLDRWQQAVRKYVSAADAKLVQLQMDSPQFASIAVEWLAHMRLPSPQGSLWAKFPDIRNAWRQSHLPKDQRVELRRRLWTQFSPALRHEAASALAAWNKWREGADGVSALVVYLIASHHGKVRTVLRSTSDADEVFGLNVDDALRPVDGYFDAESSVTFDCKSVGATGLWNESDTEFRLKSPSWIQVVSELLGPIESGGQVAADAVPDTEPRTLGPFLLAYLEALLRAADMRASRSPGKGATR